MKWATSGNDTISFSSEIGLSPVPRTFAAEQGLMVGRGATLLAKGLFALALMLAVVFAVPSFALAADEASSETGPNAGTTQSLKALSSGVSLRASSGDGSITKGAITVSRLEDFGGLSCTVNNGLIYFYVSIDSSASGTVTITSSNPAVASVVPEYASFEASYHNRYDPIDLKVNGAAGIAQITVALGSDKVTFPVAAYPEGTSVKSVSKAAYDSVSVKWAPTPGVSGYLVQRAEDDYSQYYIYTEDFKTIATIPGGQTSQAVVKAPWDKACTYRVVPYIAYGNYKLSGGYFRDGDKVFSLPKASVKITSAKKSGKSNLKVSWAADAGAQSFQVFRSTSENYGYKRLATTKSKSYTDKKRKAGVTYYYKIVAAYKGYGNVTSHSMATMIKKKTSTLKKLMSKISLESNYNTYCYTQGSKLVMVSYRNRKLDIFTISSNYKKVTKKTVKLPKHDMFGGVYHGPDGANYVALGYYNSGESKSKTVIKIVKYSKAWKAGKTASIKGDASNMFEGINTPFRAGTVSFDMQGRTLYVFTCRTMFRTDDGLNHQSNIGFEVNTKTMKAKTHNISYSSHSFNQFVKFKDGSIYLVDHGDAYPRAILVTKQDNFGLSNASSDIATPFTFMGERGDNYTGAALGDMQVGATNVLVCGIAQPHNFKVAGVSGFNGSYKYNVFVTTTNRETGENNVTWLTNINPKKGKQTVGRVRMVKISDNQFGVLYEVKNDKTGKSVVHYDVVNNAGKRVSSKTYKKLSFSGYANPVVSNGRVCWIEVDDRDYYASSGKTHLYAIPAF